MADTKISALPASTTPLAGTEVLPIVQSSATKQVSVANLTAGRVISANGVAFPATASTSADPNTLDDYEEGEWTVALTAATSGTITLLSTNNTGSYTKIGNKVLAQALVQVDSVSSPTGLLQISLPFSNGAGTEGSAYAHGTIAYFNVNLPLLTIDVSAEIVPSASVAYVKCSFDNAAWDRLDGSAVAAGSYLAFSIAYTV
jgi:hypothetical protein